MKKTILSLILAFGAFTPANANVHWGLLFELQQLADELRADTERAKAAQRARRAKAKAEAIEKDMGRLSLISLAIIAAIVICSFFYNKHSYTNPKNGYRERIDGVSVISCSAFGPLYFATKGAWRYFFWESVIILICGRLLHELAADMHWVDYYSWDSKEIAIIFGLMFMHVLGLGVQMAAHCRDD